jgi:glycosyltransferase involved in cell wall biosynthesis
MKILHITESLGAGVEHYLELVTRGQAQAGHQVVLGHSIRAETLVDQLDDQFSCLARRVVLPIATEVSLLKDAMSVWHVMRLIRQERPDVLHLHSSKAGVLGRVAALLSLTNVRVFYSPHGFAFLRQDVSSAKQKMFLWFERLAGWLPGTLVACSATEAALAVEKVNHKHVVLVENAINLDDVKPSTGGGNGVVNVLNASRACYQKAPWRFQQVAQQCAALSASFIWVGDGDWLPNDATKLRMTGWLSRSEVAKYMAKADIFLMPSLWEGMPLALIEAQAAGVPAVVSNVVGCRDVVQHGVTGFICDTDEELCARTQQLIQDAAMRQRMGDNAAKMSRSRFAVERLNAELLKLYG